MGAKPKKEARDRYKALPVSKVIHQIMTNCAIDDLATRLIVLPRRTDNF
jgi:hypothetical protein